MSRTGQLLAGIALLGGCSGEPLATEAISHMQARAMVASETSRPGDNKELAALRRVTAPLHNFEKAAAAGWSAQITACMAGADGGMGFHYGNPALIDGSVRADEPELLLYEPEENGRMRLVAVEYIIPYTLRSRSATPPVLFGQEFKQNDAFQLWALHAWVWKDNPRGLFADWNPLVTCEHTNAVSTMAH